MLVTLLSLLDMFGSVTPIPVTHVGSGIPEGKPVKEYEKRKLEQDNDETAFLIVTQWVIENNN